MKKIVIKMDFEGTQEELDNIPYFLEPVVIRTVDDEFPPIYQIHIHYENIINDVDEYLSKLPDEIKKYCSVTDIPNAFRFIMNASNIYVDQILGSNEELVIQKPDNISDEIWESVLWDVKNKDYGEFHYSQFTGYFKKIY